MKDELFDTKVKREEAVSAFQNLLGNPGWRLMVAILDANIQVAQERLEEGTGEGEKLSDIKEARLRIKLYRELCDTPEDMIKKLTNPEYKPPRLDPFDTAADVRKRKGESR